MKKIVLVCLAIILMGTGCNLNNEDKEKIADLEVRIEKLESSDIDKIFTRVAMQSMLSNQLVDIANQYNLNAYTDCETIKNRLSGIKSSFTLLDNTDDSSLFSTQVKGLKEANKNRANIVKDWDYIEFCLNQPAADTKE
ncbi:MAG: hypothetical protein HYT15_02785 [Candidatus Magasanikbacteria bacterium]|nr:hypothetical protein [Candidatus Magasanikbacteria bacterium]